jgi:gliding motility-associated lipoprotein GldH
MITIRCIRWWSTIALLVVLFTACDKNTVMDENVTLPENRWDMNNTVKLETEITDTVTPHNLYINVRLQQPLSFPEHVHTGW